MTMIATIPTSALLPEGIAVTPGVETPPELFAALVSAIGTAVAELQVPGDGEVPISGLPEQPAQTSPATLPGQSSLPDFLGLLLAVTEVADGRNGAGEVGASDVTELPEEKPIALSAEALAAIAAANSVRQAAFPQQPQAQLTAENAPDGVIPPTGVEAMISLPAIEGSGIDPVLQPAPGMLVSPTRAAEQALNVIRPPEGGALAPAMADEKQAAEIRTAVPAPADLARFFAAEQAQAETQAQARTECLPLPILASLAPGRRAPSNEPQMPSLGASDIPAPHLPAALMAALPLMASGPAAPSIGPLPPAEAIDPATLVIERELEVAQDGEWLDQLAKDISRAAGGEGGLLRFRLNPEHLGRLDVQVTQDRNGAAVRIIADNEAARTILADAQPRLVAEARVQGLRISETHVDLGQQGSGDPRRQNAAEDEAPIRTARLLQEKEEGDGNPTPARSERYA